MKRSIIGLGRGGVAWAVGMDLVGRFSPLRADGYYVGPTTWWPWVALVLAVAFAAVAMLLRLVRSERMRAWLCFLFWVCLALALIGTWGFLSNTAGGWVRFAAGAFDAAGSWIAILLAPVLCAACVFCTVGAWRIVRSGSSSVSIPSGIEPLTRRDGDSQWPYWVFVPLGSIAYTFFCMMFALEAWGRRGEVKPDWFVTFSVFATPGMMFPFVGPGILGAGLGAVAVWCTRRLLRLARRLKKGWI